MRDITVLIVEDDPLVAHIHQRYVEQTPGFACVGRAVTGNEAVDRVAGLRPDLVLLDVYLPDLDGVAALKAIRRLDLPVDVILVTAAQDAETVHESIRYGAVDYLIKPFTRDRLEQSLISYRDMLVRLRDQPRVTQTLVDSLPGYRSGTPARNDDGLLAMTDLPKGLAAWTLRQVLLFLIRQPEPQSAAAVGVGVGLSRVAARRYLEFLCEVGRAERTLLHRSVGRPVSLYRAI